MNNAEIIKQFIVTELVSDEEYTNLDYKESLIETGIIDSLGVKQLIDFLENRFSVNTNDEDILPENFENIDSIFLFVQRKKADGQESKID